MTSRILSLKLIRVAARANYQSVAAEGRARNATSADVGTFLGARGWCWTDVSTLDAPCAIEVAV